MELALQVAGWSKDRSRKIGCVIVGHQNEIRATGFNGFPRGIDDDAEERHARPVKYEWTEHAERNAIYNAARIGVALEGCRAYVCWFPCMDCARALVQCGIARVIVLRPDDDDPRWGENMRTSRELLEEAGVEIQYYQDGVLRAPRGS